MSERINVDHAFDPEARKAQADLDAYMDSRPYEDEKGNAHAADSGKFINNDKHHDALREDHYNTSLEQGDYSNESLDELAQRVATARAEGDKTRANDAEEAFFNKFAEYSEKYGWEDEDGSANGPHVNKDAKLGRSTIDDRLDRYGKIMYGETTDAQSEVPTETAVEEKEGGKVVEVAAERTKDALEGEPEAEAEESEALPVKSIDDMVEEAKREVAARADERVSEVVAQMNSTEQAKADKALLESISTEGLDVVEAEGEASELISTEGLDVIDQPNEDAALEGESLEEYEARHATDTSSEELKRIEADGLELIESDIEDDEDAQRASWFKRLATRLSPASLSARAGARLHTTRVAVENATERGDDKERRRKKKALAIGVGVLGVAAAGVGIWLAKENGVFSIDAAPSGGNEPKNPTTATDTISRTAQELFGNGKVEVGSGDGYTQVLDRVLDGNNINLSPNELYDLHQYLEQTQGDYIDLAGAGDTYTMENGDSGLSRADKGARLSEAAQQAAVRWLEARGKL